MKVTRDLEPVDKLAAIVTSPASRIHRDNYRPVPINEFHLAIIGQTLAIPGGVCPPARIPDRRGMRVGRLTVVGFGGFLKRQSHKSGGRSGSTGGMHCWVVRCDCGRHEVRNHKTLFKNQDAKCQDCHYKTKLKLITP